jgi:hypothetical protein
MTYDIPILEEALRRIKESLARLPLYGDACIYGLFDPRCSNTLHYLGYTGRDPYVRFKEHLEEARRKRLSNRVYDWIREITAAGLQVEMRVLAKGLSIEEALGLEDDLIHAFKREGHPLKNDFEAPISSCWRY